MAKRPANISKAPIKTAGPRAPKSIPAPAPADLQVEEYKYCRELTLENVKAMDRNEIYTLGAVAITMGFSLSSTNSAVSVASAFIPLALTYIARLRYSGLGIMVRSLDDYVSTLEQSNHSIGWTQYQRDTDAGVKLRRNRLLFWRVLLLGSAAFLLFQVALVADDYWHFIGFDAALHPVQATATK